MSDGVGIGLALAILTRVLSVGIRMALWEMVKTDFPTRLTPMIQIYTEQAVAVVFAHIEMVTHILTTHFLMVERMVEGVVVEAAIIMPLIEVAMPLFMVPVVAAAHSHQIMDTVPVARVIKA